MTELPTNSGLKTNYDVPIHSTTKLKNPKVQYWVKTEMYTLLNNILNSQQVSQKFWNTVSFHFLKLVAFESSGFKILKLCFKHFKMFQCLKLQLAYVPKYH